MKNDWRNEESYKELLTAPVRYGSIHDAATDAKARLERLRLHDALVASVNDAVFATSIRERQFIREDEYYAILALELLKQNATMHNALLEFRMRTPGPLFIPRSGSPS